jgi:uncharacterized protein (TIGR02145 family)
MKNYNSRLAKILFFILPFLLFSCNKFKPVPPLLTTTAATEISFGAATAGGFVKNEGGAPIVSRGICWNSSGNPTISDYLTTERGDLGAFLSDLTGLEPNTTYYIRSYATNTTVTGYGNELSFKTPVYEGYNGSITDICGNKYDTVALGTQVWLKENLNSTRYSNGDLIGSSSQWPSGNDEKNAVVFGRLYNLYAVTDHRNVCPAGWHVPGKSEWTILTDFLINNGYGNGGSGSEIAKSLASALYWPSYGNTGSVGNDQMSNNKSGFSALPAGKRSFDGSLYKFGSAGFWWTTDSIPTSFQIVLFIRTVSFNNETISNGLSVRCLRD